MSKDVLVKLKGDDQLSKTFNSASSSLTSFIQKFGGLTVATLALKEIVKFGMECAKEFAEDQKALIGFNAAIANNKTITNTAAKELLNYASSVATLTGNTESSVIAIEQFLISTGRTASETQNLIKAATNLSTVTGDDLRSSVEKLNATYDGSAGKLTKLIPVLGDLTKSQLEAGGAISIVNKQFAGMADAMGNSLDVKLKNIANSWGELKSSLGQAMMPLFNPMLTAIKSVADGWREVIDTHNKYQSNLKKAAAGDEIAILENQLITLTRKALAAKTDWQNTYKQEIQSGGSATTAFAAGAMKQKVWSDLELQVTSLTKKIEALQKGADGGKPTGGATQPVYQLIAPELYSALELFYSAHGQGNGATSNYTYVPEMEYDKDGWQPQSTPSDNAYEESPTTYIGGPIEGGIGAFSNLELVLNSVMDVFNSLTGGLMGSIGALASVQAILNPMQTIISGIMTVLGPVIETLLTPLVGILKIFGQVIGATLAPALQALSPIISIISVAFIWLYNYAIRPLGNVIIAIGNVIYNIVAGIYNAIRWIWGGKKLEYKSLSDGALEKINENDLVTAGSSSSSSSGSSASYTQQRPINVYLTTNDSLYGVPDDNALIRWHERQLALIKQGLTTAN